ncbi:MAG: hypothetical protein L6R39_004018 [Caloplaca ligustica]|nr:MAG: hypothetical protein L6R39_004018 [Caloplaca ligustica]
MLVFCPVCSNALIVSRTPGDNEDPEGRNRLECRTCPYQFLIHGAIYDRKIMPRKDVDDVLGGKDAWVNADKTERYVDPSLQRSFKKKHVLSSGQCTTCAHNWREN